MNFWPFKIKPKIQPKPLDGPPTSTFKARVPGSKHEAHRLLERARARLSRLRHKHEKWVKSGRDKTDPQPFADLKVAIREYEKQEISCHTFLGGKS